MDPALWELLRGSTDDREVEAIIRLDQPRVGVGGVRIVSRFGGIATCRLRRDAILDVRGDENVISLKAARPLGPEHAAHDGDTAWEPSRYEGDSRRPPGLPLTGAGVTVGIVDWGCDFDHPNFKRHDGSTRLRALWDQRGPAARGAPQPYGYGVLHGHERIDRALRTTDPYATLGYHPADADRSGSGAHGSHVMDIAAGNGLAGGPVGIAPEADLVFVHLAERGTSGLANLGDSVRILEAVDFIAQSAGPRPWVINISVGRHGGPHDGCTLAELALDTLLRAAPGRCIVQSAGNYFGARTHASGRLEPGQVRTLTMRTLEADLTPNELEVWYSGEDELEVRVESPTRRRTPWVRLASDADVVEDGRVVGRIYHRDRDPNNHDNHIELFLYPWAPAGRWDVSLRALQVRHGVFHAWLERDEACPDCQARFVAADTDRACTTGTIANAHLPLVVGAYDAHSPGRPLARFSSAGPTRDCRLKPDLVAPGMAVLAARSAPEGSTSSLGLLTRKSGTSMAAPHVTGAVALCLEGAPGPLAAEELRALLLRTAQPMTSATDPAARSGRGYLDLASAVTALSAPGQRAARRRPDRSTGAGRRRNGSKEEATKMDHELEQALPINLSPDTLYRELVAGRSGPVSAWATATFDVLARPGELPRTQPAAGDILVRVALGEPGLGHFAMLSDAGLMRRSALDPAREGFERGGPGLYATVTEDGAVPHVHSDRFARRILDPAGRMPLGQLLLRPLEPAGDVPAADLRDQTDWEESDDAEAAEGTQAKMDWEATKLTGFDGLPHVYYLESGPAGGGDSLFNLRIQNTNSTYNFKDPYFLVRFRYRENKVDVPVPWGDGSKGDVAGGWKRIKSEEIPDEESRVITINMHPATRRNAYDPDRPQTWVDVQYRWREGTVRPTHYGRNVSLPFYLVARSSMMFGQGKQLADKIPLNDPAKHQKFWAEVPGGGQTFGPSDKTPLKLSLTVKTDASAKVGKEVSLSGTISRTESQTRGQQREEELKSGISVGLDEVMKFEASGTTKVATSFSWTEENTRSYTEALTRSSEFQRGWGSEKNVTGEIFPPKGGGRRTAYLYPVLSRWLVPVIEYRKPNKLGQATERVVIPDVPVSVPVNWELIGYPLA